MKSTAGGLDPPATTIRKPLPLRTARTLVMLGGLLLFVAAFFALRAMLASEPVPPAEIVASAVDDSPKLDPSTNASPEPDDAPTELVPPAQPAPVAENDPDWLPQVLSLESSLVAAEEALSAGRYVGREPPGALPLFYSISMAAPEDSRASEGLARASEAAKLALDEAFEQGDTDLGRALLRDLERYSGETSTLAAYWAALEHLELLASLEATGQDALASGRLLGPSDDSAVSAFRRLRELDPESRAAVRGLRAVQSAAVSEALELASDDRFDESIALLARVRFIGESSTQVIEAETKVFRQRSQKTGRFATQAREAMARGDFDLAQVRIDDLTKITSEPAFVAALAEELANARLYSIHRPGDVFFDAFNDGAGTGPAMVVLPVGQFRMGSSPREKGTTNAERPRVYVTFATGFSLARTEITVGQFRAFVAATGYTSSAESAGSSYTYNDTTGRVARKSDINWRNNFAGNEALDSQPVIHVSWLDAQAYASWLASMTGQPYRLASEAEFEYATRAGTTTRFWWGDESPTLPVTSLAGDGDKTRRRREWDEPFEDYADGHWGPSAVGTFVANPFGLYDMTGNVSEWVTDCWHGSYARAPRDGSSWVNVGCDRRVVRGGFWGSSPDRTRSAFRVPAQAETTGPHLGFRVARSLVDVTNSDE